MLQFVNQLRNTMREWNVCEVYELLIEIFEMKAFDVLKDLDI